MSRERRHDWDAPDDVDDGDLDKNSSSSDDISNAVRYVPTSAGSPVKVLSRAVKVLSRVSLLNNPPAKFEELDIARRNAAMNSSRETLLREEEEHRKRLRFPLGLESDHETSPSGKPDHCKICENETRTTNHPNEDLSDDNASDLIALQELMNKTSDDPVKPKEHLTLDRTDLKAEFTDQTEQKAEMTKVPLIDLDSGDNGVEPQVTPQLVLLDSYDEAEKANKEAQIPPENPG